jgi:hypothetical protein
VDGFCWRIQLRFVKIYRRQENQKRALTHAQQRYRVATVAIVLS